MPSEPKPGERLVVAYGQPNEPGGTCAFILGMTPAGFALMASGETHTVDLTAFGIKANIIIMRGDSHADIARQLNAAGQELNLPILDGRKIERN